jgi:hypothetical protein
MSNLTIAQEVIEHIKVAGEIADRAQRMTSEKQAQDRAVAAKIPEAVDALVQKGFLPSEYAEQCKQALADPVRALDVLINTACYQPDSVNHLGAQVDEGRNEKKASIKGNTNSPYCGGRYTSKRESDRIFEQGILGRQMA